MTITDKAVSVLGEVAVERAKQDAKWGEQNHPDYYDLADQGWTQNHYASMADSWKDFNADRVKEQNEAGTPKDRNCAWDGILLEEVYEALAECNPTKLRAELIQVAAVAVAWCEAIDRRTA